MNKGIRQFIEWGLARIAARLRNFEVGFDLEVLSLPGGSVIAVLLLIYTVAKKCIEAS